MNDLYMIIGLVLIFAATDVNRKEDSKIGLFSWSMLLQMILIGFGVALILQANGVK